MRRRPIVSEASATRARGASSESDEARTPYVPDAWPPGHTSPTRRNTIPLCTGDKRSILREVLPVPDVPRSGLVTYDAKDTDTAFAPQPVRRRALLRRERREDPGRHAPGADGVRLRRPGPRQGRHGAAVPERR